MIPARLVIARHVAATVILTFLLGGCAATSMSHTAQVAAVEADGIFVHAMRLRVAPSHTQACETLLKRCVSIAQRAELPESHEWLCYRESPGRYWIITFSETIDGFAYPSTFEGLITSIASRGDAVPRGEVRSMLDSLEYETEWRMLTRQKTEWSTVESMSTSTHPKARIMLRTIRPGQTSAFDDALTARTAFLAEHGYALPIEGFVTLDASPAALRHTAMQVVFPVDWPSFHSTDSFGVFVRSLDQTSQDDYARRKAALMNTMSRAEFYDGSYAAELRYTAE